MSGTTPAGLLDRARQLVEDPTEETRGLWSRAAALLGRQALETCLKLHWQARAPALAKLPYSTQLVCLREFMADTRLAQRVGHTWGELSAACHYHGYGIGVTAEELRAWFEVVDALMLKVSATGARAT